MLDKYLLEDQQDSERDSIVILRGMGLGHQAHKTCPTVLETIPVAGLSDQQDSERDTIVVLWGMGAGREVIEPVSHPCHLQSCRRHEREDMAAVPEMINYFEVSLFIYLLLLLSCTKYAIN